MLLFNVTFILKFTYYMNEVHMPETESGSAKVPYLGYVITALITALIVSGAWMLFGINTIESNETVSPIKEITPATKGETVKIKDPIEANAEEKNDSLVATSTLLFEQFKKALYEERKVAVADQHEKNPNKIYYVTDGRDSLGVAIWEYDTNNDPSYAFTKGKNFNVAEGSRVLLEYKVKEEGNIIFRVGLRGDNYIFFEMNGDYSPGPCAEPEFWLNSGKPGSPKLQYIDVTAEKPVAKPYIPTQADKEKAMKELKLCTDQLKNS